jgi:hypothetical protein
MKKKMMMMGVLLCCFLGMAVDAFAGSKKEVDDYLAITTGLTAVTNDVQLIKGGTEIDHITLNNTSAVTTTVTVAISEVGVSTALVTAEALAPGGTTVVYPRRTVAFQGTTNQTFYVADTVKLINSISATNAATITTRCFIQSRQ